MEFPPGSYLILMLQRAALLQWLTCRKTSQGSLMPPWLCFLEATGVAICFAGGHVLLAAAGATGVCLNLVQNAITSQEAPLAESHSLRMSRHVVFWQAPAEEEGETLRGVCKRRTSFRTSYCRCTRARCQGDPARRAGKQSSWVVVVPMS